MDLTAAVVTRSIVLPVPAEDVWASICDADGLVGWLGDAVELDLALGAAGAIIDADLVRRVVVTGIEAGRSIGFVWWDEATPQEASTVSITLTPSNDGTSTVTVTERLAGSASAGLGLASIPDLVGAAERVWDRRLQALVGDCGVTAAVTAVSSATA